MLSMTDVSWKIVEEISKSSSLLLKDEFPSLFNGVVIDRSLSKSSSQKEAEMLNNQGT